MAAMEPATSPGDSPWRTEPLCAAPGCDFFPRVGFCVAPVAAGTGIYVLGGQKGGKLLNDIWLLRVGGTAHGGLEWVEVSPNRDPKGTVAAGETVVSSKWSGRERFSAAVATISPGRQAMYVCGGLGKQNYLADFWASEDTGKNWYCMIQQLPFGGRVDAVLLTVPGRYEQLVLCSGMSRGDEGMQMNADLWVSLDAGAVWQELTKAPGPSMERRSMPLATFLPGTTAKGTRRLLVLGGTCVGEEREALLGDAWEADVDVEARSVAWRRLGDPGEAPAGFNGHTAAFDHGMYLEAEQAEGGDPGPAGGIVAIHDLCLCTSRAAAPHEWAPASLSHPDARAMEALKSGKAHLCMAPVRPRLFLTTEDSAFVTMVADGAGTKDAAGIWEVIGGATTGGIVVREEKDLKSRELPRLQNGARVEEIELAGNRLHFRMLLGRGPPDGWVNVTLSGKALAVRL